MWTRLTPSRGLCLHATFLFAFHQAYRLFGEFGRGQTPMRLIVSLAAVAALSLATIELGQPGAQFVAMPHVTFNCDTDAECAALPPCAQKPGCDGSPYTDPYRLVGYDCVGAIAPLYRDEEDEFPRCGSIELVFN